MLYDTTRIDPPIIIAPMVPLVGTLVQGNRRVNDSFTSCGLGEWVHREGEGVCGTSEGCDATGDKNECCECVSHDKLLCVLNSLFLMSIIYLPKFIKSNT